MDGHPLLVLSNACSVEKNLHIDFGAISLMISYP